MQAGFSRRPSHFPYAPASIAGECRHCAVKCSGPVSIAADRAKPAYVRADRLDNIGIEARGHVEAKFLALLQKGVVP
jgi:hypothetical protein